MVGMIEQAARKPRSWPPRRDANDVGGRHGHIRFWTGVSCNWVPFECAAQSVLVPGNEGDFPALSEQGR